MDAANHMSENRPIRSAMAITGIVIGAIALLTSFIPIINNFSFILALLGTVFAIVGIIGCMRGKRRGKGMAIAGLVLNILAIILVLATQSMYSAALDEAVSGPQVQEVQSGNDPESETAEETTTPETDNDTIQTSQELGVGTSVTLDNGLQITVDSVQAGLINYDGAAVTGIHVTYLNNGSETVDFNMYDWMGENEQGVQDYPIFFADSSDALESGSLTAGGTVSGSVYFEGETIKALYSSNLLNDTPTATWVLQ